MGRGRVHVPGPPGAAKIAATAGPVSKMSWISLAHFQIRTFPFHFSGVGEGLGRGGRDGCPAPTGTPDERGRAHAEAQGATPAFPLRLGKA